MEPPRPAGETRNVKEADVWITSLTRNILIIFFRLHKKKRAHRRGHKQGDKMLIWFFLDYSDPCFLWIFLLTNSVFMLLFQNILFVLPFCSYVCIPCGVLSNTYVHHNHPFKTVQRWKKLRWSTPHLPFDLSLGIKQVQTVVLIRVGSKEICLGAVQRAVMKLNKCL